MTEPASRTTGDRRPGRVVARWPVAAALAGGLLAGGLLGAALGGGTDGDAGAAGRGTAVPAPTGAAPPDEVEVRVDEACLRAIAAAREALAVVDDVGEALVRLDAARLDEIVHRLQPLRADLAAGEDACQVVTRYPDGATSTRPPPAPSPTTTPPSPGG